jgi:hypothetical protein
VIHWWLGDFCGQGDRDGRERVVWKRTLLGWVTLLGFQGQVAGYARAVVGYLLR